MGGRREVSIIFYRPVTRSDLKRERSFFRVSVSSFLQLVVAFTEFGGELGDQQRPVLERNDMKLGPPN